MLKKIGLALSHLLVAVAATVVTLTLFLPGQQSGTASSVSKLEQLQALIEERFIGEVDSTAMEDAAASAMIDSLGDRWSYYIAADDYASYREQMANAYVGVGITITERTDGTGFDIIQVDTGGSAYEEGLQAGDILTKVEGQSVAELGMDGARDLVRGEEGTQVKLTVLRDGQELEFTLTRKQIKTVVAAYQLLEGNVGYITIANFDERCAQETIACIEAAIEEGATSLLFDVRYNPGGYASELVELLDYLLPEGDLFRTVDYAGNENVDKSGATCLEMPMAVLVNANSYSAAEFFAAALSEYEWATVVGEATVGKGYFQQTYQLKDGSAVGLSVGKYFTPKGVSLDGVGITPDIPVAVDEETAAAIYYGTLEPMEDPQVQAALEALK